MNQQASPIVTSLYYDALKRMKVECGWKRNELWLIIEAFSNKDFDPDTTGEYLVTALRTHISLNDADKTWGLEAEALIAKVEALSLFDRASLEIWACAYWHQPKNKIPLWLEQLTP